MKAGPSRPKLYHITHVKNLAAIVTEGCLVSDSIMLRRGGPAQAIGMSAIKRRRVEELDVACHPGTKVGDFVPFYFCPRSIMLYVIHCANHPELAYRGGQNPIVHLEADLHRVVEWADQHRAKWAITSSNAGARYAQFRSDLAALNGLDWKAIDARDFRDPDIKEHKQAEFLVHERFPFSLIERIGVRGQEAAAQVHRALSGASYRPLVDIRPDWYF